MQKVFQTQKFRLIKNLHLPKNNFLSLKKFQAANFAEKSMFTRFLDLRKKLDASYNVAKINDHKQLPKKELDEAETILLSVIGTKEKAKIQEIIPEVQKILTILTKSKILSKNIINIVNGILKELKGVEFPFFLIPEYLEYLYVHEKHHTVYFPPNFVSDFEKHFYEKAMMLKVKELSLLFPLIHIFENKFSSNFIPYLEKTILLNINNEKFLYLKSCEFIMSEIRKNALNYTSNHFLAEYLSVYNQMIITNSLNFREFNLLLRYLQKRIKTNFYDFQMREIMINFFEGCKEVIQNLIEDEGSYEQEFFFSFLLIAKNSFLTPIFNKNIYNTIIKKIHSKTINRQTLITLITHTTDLSGISMQNIEKIDLHLIHQLGSFREIRDFYTSLKYAKKFNNVLLTEIIFLNLTKFLVDNGNIDNHYLNILLSFKQGNKVNASLNKFCFTMLDVMVKKNSKKLNTIEEKSQNEVQNIDEDSNN